MVKINPLNSLSDHLQNLLNQSTSMAVPRLSPRFFASHTPLPTSEYPSPQLFFTPVIKPLTLGLRSQLTTPFLLSRIVLREQQTESLLRHNTTVFKPFSVAFPSLAFSNTSVVSSAYNVNVTVGDNEPEEKLLGRFRREVFKAGVIQECKRRRFFETFQEKRKRKAREAARRNRRRRPRPNLPIKVEKETSRKKQQDLEEDNWEVFDVDLPYT